MKLGDDTLLPSDIDQRIEELRWLYVATPFEAFTEEDLSVNELQVLLAATEFAPGTEEVKSDLEELIEWEDFKYHVDDDVWDCNETLIHDDCAEERVLQEFREQLESHFFPGEVPEIVEQIWRLVDYRQLADELLANYSIVEFRGHTYYHF